eukprot:6460534-Pyramimonas_sp.AAC.1
MSRAERSPHSLSVVTAAEPNPLVQIGHTLPYGQQTACWYNTPHDPIPIGLEHAVGYKLNKLVLSFIEVTKQIRVSLVCVSRSYARQAPKSTAKKAFDFSSTVDSRRPSTP